MKTLRTTSRLITLIALLATSAIWGASVDAKIKPRAQGDEPVRPSRETNTRKLENRVTPLNRATDFKAATTQVEVTDIGPEGGIVSGLEGFLINPRNSSQILASTFHNSVFKSIDGGLTWFRSNRGLTDPGGVLVDATNIRRDPNNPTTVYALGQDVGQLFRSPDFGDNWVPVGVPFDSGADFALRPTVPGVIYVLDVFGDLFKSTDGGGAFVQQGNGLPFDVFGGYTNIAIVASSPDTMYVVDEFGDSQQGGVYKSVDGGLNFTRLDSSPPFPLQVFPHPTDPNAFFLQAVSGSTDMFRSTDGGATLTEVTGGLPAGQQNDFASFDPRDSSIVYMAGEGGVFRSTDGGSTFNRLGLSQDQVGLSASNVSIDPANSDLLYVNTNEGNFKSNNGGRSFISINRGFKAAWIQCLTFDTHANPSLYVGNLIVDTLLRTGNRGESYDRLSYPPDRGAVRSTALSETDRNFIVVVTSRGILRSTDGGRSWTPAVTGVEGTRATRFFRQVVVDPHDANNVYATNDDPQRDVFYGGLYRSTDGAQTFKRSTGGLPISLQSFTNLAIDPNDPQVIFAESRNRLVKSTDAGSTFNLIGSGLSVLDVHIIINPRNSQEIYLGGDILVLQNGSFSEFTIVRSDDGGATFSPVDAGLPPVFDDVDLTFVGLAMDPTNPAKLYAWFRQGLFMTEDGALTWTLLDTGETLRRSGLGKARVTAAMAINPKNSNLLYLGGSSILQVDVKR